MQSFCVMRNKITFISGEKVDFCVSNHDCDSKYGSSYEDYECSPSFFTGQPYCCCKRPRYGYPTAGCNIR